MTCDFSMKHYEECMKMISEARDCNIELLHDLDHAEENILDISNIEAQHNVKAKYFIRIHAKNYNAFSLKSLETYRMLSYGGHELGLHFEPGFYLSEPQVWNGIVRESEFLEHAIGLPIKYVSIHEPARFGSVSETLIPKNLRYYCWDSSYYKDKKYISDSSARWREGCMCQHIGLYENLIILTHPIWWYKNTSAENY